MSATMEIGLESLDGRVYTVIVAKTSNNICGRMKPIIWLQIKDQWKHLREIPSPKLGKRSKIDVLIGLDHYNLLLPMKEVRGGDNDPSASRLCPLRWTAIGIICTSERHGTSNTGCLNTYRIQRSECSDGGLKYLLKQFCSLEVIGITPQVEQPLSPKEKIAFDKVNESIRFDAERYEVDVPWKHERPEFITWHMKIIYVNSGVKNYMKEDHRRALHRYRGGQRFESRTSLNFFFRLSFCNCKSCVHNCGDLPSYNSSLRSSHIWFSFIHNFIILLSLVYNESIGHFRVPRTFTFKTRPSAQTFLWKWVLFAWEWKIISTSKAELLISFWCRGAGKLGNGLFIDLLPVGLLA